MGNKIIFFLTKYGNYILSCAKDPEGIIREKQLKMPLDRKVGSLYKMMVYYHHFIGKLTGKSSEKLADRILGIEYSMLNNDIKRKREKELIEIEKKCIDPQTKEALIILAGINNKHYRKHPRVAQLINEMRESAPKNNLAVQKRIQEIIGEARK